MDASPRPKDEAARLKALYGRAILDTPPEERFDRIARRMFETATARISLVDAERVWFKSRLGINAQQANRNTSFCGHTILDDAILQVPDTSADPRFAQNPMVTGPPHIRFYVGAPLHSPGGHRIGALCLTDDKPRTFTAEQLQALRDLADWAEEEINRIEYQQQKGALEQAQQLSDAIARAQSRFIREADRRNAFDSLLTDILALTDSEYGFIGEVLTAPSGQPYLKTYAITNIAWDDTTRSFYDKHAPQGMEFFNLNTLFGAALTSGEPVIANTPSQDSRRGGLPEGHPPLNAFLGIPIHHGGELVAMLGIANRPNGYDQTLTAFLQPLLVTIGQLVDAARVQQRHREDQIELARLSRVASQTTNGVVITDTEGKIEWLNDGFTRITGYTLDDIRGKRPGDVLQGEATDPDTVAKMGEALSRGESFDVEAINYTKSGQPYWIHISCNPLRDAAGKLQGFMAIESDITREKNDAERLRESERRLAAVIEGTHIGTWEWNVQTGETVFNERWADIVGYTLAELEPINIQTWLDLAHPDDLEHSNTVLQRHFAGELDYYDIQCRMRHKSGHWIWVHDRGRVVSWSDDGKPLLMSGTHADITEQKKAELALQRNEARLRGLFELSPVGIALNDYETGAFVEANDALLTPTGHSREAFMKLNYWDITPREYESQEAVQLQQLNSIGRYGPYEKEYIRKDGSRYPVLLNGMLVDDPSGRKMIWSIVEDITERKRIERMKSEFVSTVSHELRTPLTSISGALSLLSGGALGELPKQLQEMITIAYKNSQRLSLLINDLLDMEKLAAGKMRFDLQPQALMPLIEQAVHDNQTYAKQYNVEIQLRQRADGIHVNVDTQRLQQVLANLLSNAAKFSPHGDVVTLTVSVDDSTVRVEVADHGPGIPAEFQQRIFQKFAQADASDTRQKGGTGLGLAISKELIERMGGQIGFTSTEGQGTTFHFQLPRLP